MVPLSLIHDKIGKVRLLRQPFFETLVGTRIPYGSGEVYFVFGVVRGFERMNPDSGEAWRMVEISAG